MNIKMLQQCLDVGMFGIHIGYTIAKLELLHRIIIGILNFGYWYSIIAVISSIIAVCMCDIKFDILSNQDVLNCFVKPIFHYVELINKIDTKIRKLISKNKYSRMIDELETKFSYWVMSVLIRILQYIFNQSHNDAVTELLRTNQVFNTLLYIDHHVFLGNDPSNALATAVLNMLRNPAGNADHIIRPQNNNNNNAFDNDIYRMFGLQHGHMPVHDLAHEFVFGPEGIIRATPAEGVNDHIPVNSEFRHEPDETDDESEEEIESDDDPIIALNAEQPQEHHEPVVEPEIQPMINVE